LPESSKPSAAEKAGTSSPTRNLMPSEIESLREDMLEADRELEGRFYLEQNGKLKLRPRNQES